MRIEDHGAKVGGSDRVRDSHLTDHTLYSELNFKAVLQFVIGLAVIVALSYLSMWGMFELFKSQRVASSPVPSPTAQVEWVAPAVDVQPAPRLERVLIEAAEEATVESEVAAGNRISIEAAIDKTLEQGLPYRATGTATTSSETPETVENEAESGE